MKCPICGGELEVGEWVVGTMEMPTNLVINYAYCNGLDEDDEPCPFFLVRESKERLLAELVNIIREDKTEKYVQ